MPTLSLAPPAESTIEVVSPAPRRVWRDLLAQQGPHPMEATPDWMDCVTSTGRHTDASRWYRLGDRSVVVPLAAPRYGGRLAPLSSLPFDWGYGGIVTGSSDLQPDEITMILNDLAHLPTLRLRLSLTPGTPAAWARAAEHRFPAIDQRTVHLLDLTEGLDAVLSRYSTNRRKSVRRAERRGVEVEVDRTGRRLPVFYELFDKSIERWAAEQHEPLALCRYRNHRANSRAKLATVAQRLGDRCAVWTAWVDGKPAAASIVLRNGAYLTGFKSAADVREFGSTGAVDLLKTAIIADGCATDAAVYDLGESRPGSNLAKFKAAYGAREHHVHVIERERLPLRRTEDLVRTAVRRAVGFHDR